VRIDDVARKLVEQSGREIDIVYTGLREGEKMDEILISGTENDARPLHPLISHVRVSPLPVEEVRAGLAADTLPAAQLLRQWCAAPDPGTVPGQDPETSPATVRDARDLRDAVLEGA